ncbi:carboxypeptidase-like regulatory domain-containing protein [Robiginitalea sp. M366]|uniref:carboxypeptidase-like regulatory domain-containing protein n=1 Tax=Robiginitalea aestuariiviva TaxID=3036903 RepID=UPI00240DF1CB|nr:carboxypeptidase-like regulatory domain-containing protein [Robiginitalea aestuariiviva]MDG1573065.1 carboxypeptidase-like regulatory domain-containing protein [Robiginitalea aestuariiviva]
MQRCIVLMFLVLPILTAGQQRELSGTVSDGRLPLADVSIRVAGTDTGTFTNGEGKYRIVVQTRDTLVFSAVGYKTYRYLVEDIARFHNPVLLPEIIELDEVVVQKRIRKTQEDLRLEYPYNNNLFQTAFGFIDASTMANSVRVISEEEILPVGVCILDFLRNRIPGIRVLGDCYGGGTVTLRGGVGSITQTLSPFWDVDGMIFREAPIWIPLDNIKRIAIVAGLGFTARYGQAGGVIVINTRSFSPKKTKEFDLARLRNNYLENPVPTRADLIKDLPGHLSLLQGSKNLQEARVRYDSLNERIKSSPYFVVDAYRVFSEQFEDFTVADALIEEHAQMLADHPVALKALAYYYESQGRLNKAEDAYEAIFRLRPKYLQSYLDMVRIKRMQGEPLRAHMLLQQYRNLVNQEKLPSDTLNASPFLEREINNLYNLHKRELLSAKSYNTVYIDPDDETRGTMRIVVEWNHSDADFELQFVNPSGQYYTWRHSVFEDAEAIMQEKIVGFSSKEFILDRSLPGRWRINVTYLGNKSLTPTYLKITRYEHYGTSRQHMEIEVHRLQVKNLNYELVTLNNPANFASKK